MPGHWLLGNLLEFKRAPHEFLQKVGAHGDGLVQFRLLHKHMIAITTPEAAEHVFKIRSKNFPRGKQRKALQQVLGLGLITQQGAPWKHHRRIIAQAFRPDFLEYSLEQNSKLVTELLRNWDTCCQSGEAVDVVEEMRQITLAVIVRALFSVDLDFTANQALYSAIVNANQLMFKRHTSIISPPAWFPSPLNRALDKTRRVMDEFIQAQLRQKEANASAEIRDIADHLLAEETKGEIDRQQILDEIRTLLVAGFETTATSLAWTLYLLARDPGVQKAWQAELNSVLQGRPPAWGDMNKLPLTEAIVMEALRLYPPAYGITRSAKEDSLFDGIAIPAESDLVLSIYGIQRDEATWRDAEVFRPGRFLDTWPRHGFMPFGIGRHICIGSRFSILESMLILACVGQRFQITQAEQEEVYPEVGVTLLPDRAIRLQLEAIASPALA